MKKTLQRPFSVEQVINNFSINLINYQDDNEYHNTLHYKHNILQTNPKLQ